MVVHRAVATTVTVAVMVVHRAVATTPVAVEWSSTGRVATITVAVMVVHTHQADHLECKI